MADKKISELPVLTNADANDADIVPIVDVSSGITSKITLAELLLRFQGNDGPAGPAGATGATGPQGASGIGVINGGTTNQALTKIDEVDGNTQWSTIDKTFVGLSNVDNTSDATKDAATATLSNKTFGNKTKFNAEIVGASADISTAGSGVTIAAPGVLVNNLTGALVSLSGITAVSDVQILILVNKTGADLTVNDEDATATAANRIITGTGDDLIFKSLASLWLVYDPTAARWRIVGGSGGGGAGDFQGVYDNSTSPQLTLNSTQGSLLFRDASTPIGTTLFAVQNNAGTATYLGIGANGLSTTNFTGTGTTGAVRLHNLTTGQRNALTPAAGMIVYDTTLNQLQGYANGDWGELTRERQAANTGLAAGAELAISLTHSRQTWLVAGASAPVTLSATPFGSAEPVYGAEITLIGNSDANAVTIPVNDASFGVIGYSVTLGKGQVATYKYNGTLLRYVIKSVSN